MQKIAKQLRGLIKRQTEIKAWPATIVSAGSRPAYSVVKFSNGLELETLNYRMSSVAGLKIRVGYDPLMPGVLQVLGTRESVKIIGAANSYNFWILDHHENHEFPGHDTVWIQGAQFLPLAVLGGSGLTVKVYGVILERGGDLVAVDTTTLDLTSNVPASGARWVLISIDETGDWTVTNGSTVGSKEILTLADVPARPSGHFRVAAVRLYQSQTKIQHDVRAGKPNDVLDLRWADFASGGDGGMAWSDIDSAAADTPLDADKFGFWDAVDAALKSITWTNIKSTLKTYFDTVYAAIVHTHAATDVTSGTLDGDRLPALSATKRGGVPATGAPSGLLLRDDDTWVAGGTGDVTGPPASVDARIATFDGVTGKAIKDSGFVPGDFAVAAKGVTNGDSHGHVGGDGAQIAHGNLSGIGTNSHATIDTHLANTTNPHSVTAAQAVAIPESGWIARAETWTRTGNHTFTVAGDVTAVFRKGLKVRYKDGGSYEYGVIASSTYSAPNTTVTLITNTDYAMAAGAVTDTALSPVENPEGFPAYFNYTPPLAGGGSMTIASSTINFARWWVVKDVCHFAVDIDVSFGGTANARFDVSLPVTALFANVAIVANCRDTGSGALPVGTGTIGTTTLIYFRKADISVWTLAATSRVYGCGEYPF